MNNILLSIAWGDTLSLVGICFGMVLTIMIVLVYTLKIFGVVQKKGKKEDTKEVIAAAKPETNNNKKISDDEYAAIATAIHLYFGGEHDNESNVLTIKNISQNYSPWLN